jgi:hypothetical protein
LFIKAAFLFRPNVVVTAVPYHLGHAARLSDLAMYDESLAMARNGSVANGDS